MKILPIIFELLHKSVRSTT